jgi:hypothetical protein
MNYRPCSQTLPLHTVEPAAPLWGRGVALLRPQKSFNTASLSLQFY